MDPVLPCEPLKEKDLMMMAVVVVVLVMIMVIIMMDNDTILPANIVH